MKIHAIQTGTVAIKTRQVQAVGHGARRQLNMFLDRQWTEPLPIYAFAIEHPEGVIVVDTGETRPQHASPATSRAGIPTTASGCACGSRPSRRSGPQLQRLGIAPGDVRRVVLTHLHTDHAGGLHHFPGTEILVSRADLEVASGLRGRLRGYPNDRWPELVRADRRRPRARRLRAVPAEPAADAGRRRHHRAPPRPHRGPARASSSRTATTPSCSPATAPTPRT